MSYLTHQDVPTQPHPVDVPRHFVPNPRIGGLMKIFFFANGNTLVVDDKGRPADAHKEPWFRVMIDRLARAGVDVEKAEIRLPDGKRAEIVQTQNGWNWHMPKK
jgi:hypothetical protein